MDFTNGLSVTLLPEEEIVFVDSIANQHGLLKFTPQGNKSIRVALDFPSSVGIVRGELLKKSPSKLAAIDACINSRSNNFYLGTVVSGCVSGTADTVRRGVVVSLLGCLNPSAETPLRFLVKTPDFEWFVLNSTPVNQIPTHDCSRKEIALMREFNKVFGE